MKKKFISMLLVSSMVLSMTACSGNDAQAPVAETPAEAPVAEAPAETAPEATEAPETDTTVETPVEAVVETPVENTGDADVVAADEIKVPENMKLEMEMAEEGITLNITIENIGEDTYFAFAANDAICAMFRTEENTYVYVNGKMNGEETSSAVYASNADLKESGDDEAMDTSGLVDTESIVGADFTGAVYVGREDGYDVFTWDETDEDDMTTTYTIGVNPETKYMEYVKYTENGNDAIMYISEIDAITSDTSWVVSATKAESPDEVAWGFVGGIMMIALSGMDFSEDGALAE